jgi:hypothetical protein
MWGVLSRCAAVTLTVSTLIAMASAASEWRNVKRLILRLRVVPAVVVLILMATLGACGGDGGSGGDGDSSTAVKDCIEEVKRIAEESGLPAGPEDEIRRSCEFANP